MSKKNQRLESSDVCPCQPRPDRASSGLSYGACCEPYHCGLAVADTAEALMRSRYTAFVVQAADYLSRTWHPSTRPETVSFNPDQRWLGLKIKNTEQGQMTDAEGWVEFVARSKANGRGSRLEERSHFVRLDGEWVYLRG